MRTARRFRRSGAMWASSHNSDRLMADLPNILIFLVPYTLGFIYLKCWQNFLKNEDPDYTPEAASTTGASSSSLSDSGTLTHGHA